jgi:hypothetical protein
MTYTSAQVRDDRIKKLESFLDDWQKMINENDNYRQRLMDLKIAGIDEYDEAILRAIEAGNKLAEAKSNIEATINRVRSGGQ